MLCHWTPPQPRSLLGSSVNNKIVEDVGTWEVGAILAQPNVEPSRNTISVVCKQRDGFQSDRGK